MSLHYTFVEKFGHGRKASRNARVDEVDVQDDDGHTYRLWVMPGCTREQAAQEFMNLQDPGQEPLVLCKASRSFWLEKADPELWDEEDGMLTYRLSDHPHAVARQ